MTTETTKTETRAERLARLLTLALPEDAKRIASGDWGPGKAPYEFKALPDGRQKLVITNPVTEDRYGFVGKDRDDLLDQLEARFAPKPDAQ